MHPGFILVAVLGLAALPLRAEPRQIPVTELTMLPLADVVILGEVHDNPAHHENQATALGAMQPAALVFEMLTEAQALQIRPGLLGDPDLLEQVLEWETRGWPDFAMYFPLFQSAGGAPVFGGALPRDAVRGAMTDGAAAVMGGAAELFGLHDALDDHEQVAREALQMAAHCDALPVHMLAGMVEAQRLRDAGLARAVIAALAEAGGPVAVITGNGHAHRDWGVPKALELVAPDLVVLSVAQLEAEPGGVVPYDLWLVTDAVERDDPCAAFSDR
ncbi:MAG: ChaN family lipoprotein [Rhodobacteraceae bacterium]|nr:ChaN family lipoprotein [Paracoccaceae bacterium]